MRRILCLAGLLSFLPSRGQEAIDTQALKHELAIIYESDQKARKMSDSIAWVDSTNLLKVEAIISKYGWPGKSLVGLMGNYTVWLVIQHADLGIQEKYLPMMRKSVEQNESRPVDLAMLEDRVLMRQGKKQLYGSQVTYNRQTGQQEIWPIEDEKNVNVRRKKVGLEPMEEYARHFGITYRLPE